LPLDAWLAESAVSSTRTAYRLARLVGWGTGMAPEVLEKAAEL
jgi:hypothetical protein